MYSLKDFCIKINKIQLMKKILLSAICALTSCSAQVKAQTEDVCSNLLSMYRFNNTATDQNGNSSFNNAVYAAGVIGQAFSSTNGAASATISNLPTGTAARTVSFMLRRESGTVLTNFPTIFKYGPQVDAAQFGAYYNSDGSIVFQSYGSGNAHIVTNSTFPASAWHHIAISYDGTNVRFYLNGTLRDTWAQTLATVAGSFVLGGTGFDGRFDDLRIYSRALTGSEIAYLYSYTEADPCPACTVTIPDANFKNYLLNNTAINTNSDTEIQCTEAQAFTGIINCPGLNISSLSGIEEFTQMTGLNCYGNQIATLNLSSNTALTGVVCGNNPLNNVFIGILPDLTSFNCTNATSSFDLYIDNNTALTQLKCSNSGITSLGVSNCPALYELDCSANSLTSLNLSSCSALGLLQCSQNQFTSINVSNNTALVELECTNNLLTSLDVSNNTALELLNCSDNMLTSLNVSSCATLYNLQCNYNQLTSLDLSNNPTLTFFGCFNNVLTSLNMANGHNTLISNNSFRTYSNTNLTCIKVDNAAWSTSNWTMWIDPQNVFSETCSAIGIEEISKGSFVKVYPNPVAGNLFIETEKPSQLSISDVLGKVVYTGELKEGVNEIEINVLQAGVYFITETNGAKAKFVKE